MCDECEDAENQSQQWFSEYMELKDYIRRAREELANKNYSLADEILKNAEHQYPTDT